ncbi:hypothetical protein S7711_07436 [Stachybotrys chartarum IBT 7711]|uniref:Uncharacterized protein n=1 Tax=Stachybotrys chartarum (strain CBS 109288 / IBT 7711) TaxID=1280523 RepID=A0A084AFJ5_STACB|nr:hypothetical protein S7711_07436 [Stachybotrys chartarum IBT 7711]KFA47753.1 hypothetical protein S40293_07125 [Stachybotrys chartarum IBT 40293]KFA78962.1 hypothetical protein S40288_00631 [Stachybotrys chartarum IBT 40288]
MDFDDDDAAMQQAMGFSAFGAQDHPQKKRRYNPHADAAVPTVSDTPGFIPKGSNSTPLSATRRGGDKEASGLDGGVDSTNATTSTLAPSTAANPNAGAQDPTIQAQPRPAGLPERPAVGVDSANPSYGGGTAHHRGAKNDKWYEGYYDPSSNENPWQRLESSLKLQSKGSWLPRGGPQHAVPA